MTTWAEIVADVPDFAARVQALFDAGTNKTLATLRSDGSPRISGTELVFENGTVTLGMMPRSAKLRDVLRDPRVAIHSPTLEPPAVQADWPGDAKLAGRLVPTAESTVDVGGAFEVDVTEVALIRLDAAATMLVIESWHPGRGHETVARA